MTLEKGQPAPDFELNDADGNTWKLSDLKGKKVIVYFYPADDTPGCTVQACDFRDNQQDFVKAGYVTLGISPQGEKSKQRFTDKYDLNFPLLADEGAEVAKRYGVTADLGTYNGIKLSVKRSTFIVDEEGNLEDVQYGVRAKGHVEELLEAISA